MILGYFRGEEDVKANPVSRHVAVAVPCGSLPCSSTSQNPEGVVKSLEQQFLKLCPCQLPPIPFTSSSSEQDWAGLSN